MVMRYYWGLAVGHTYTHKESQDDDIVTQSHGTTTERHSQGVCDIEETQTHDPVLEDEEMQYSLEDRDDDNWQDWNGGDSDDDDICIESASDIEMYASGNELVSAASPFIPLLIVLLDNRNQLK
jgi:hypothetical protein